ncbi:3-hydroxyacyl-CoA dehydrogenase [Pseudomaricurvus alkylphenolicus]|uniref:3-hydroxyacyl-CoA dehydrogenase NAD-binding domain-containing protein n=1 Tax=Pseudomaricurvus alkylphenolicus TaxID=1306991 RepID=UPI00141E25DC|nr:3-hydroxyacyl-CoA dehydrogenase NAD-binding domain-containing protein [Pseudomaricurvus alkylphenolicus]NIB38163.1 3-hydroxyacyl-CoA dehydrogenase [Pseudomaricurvus alkylphenolicus]
MSVFNYDKDNNDIVTITMNMTGPVNAMNAEYNDAMRTTIERLEAEPALTGVIFASTKKTFFAGGDLNDLVQVEADQIEDFFKEGVETKNFLRRIEKLPAPVVAAINGAALGGGFEICLSCNYRIAWDSKAVIVGLPEVGLGLLPGAGGVVRLTNLLGLEKALPYLLEGKKIKAAKALSEGLINETVDTVDELVPRAKAWILAQKGDDTAALQPWDQKGFKVPGGNIKSPKVAQLASMAPQQLMQKTRGLLPAPERILETAVEAVTVDFDTALRIETRKFMSLVPSAVAKNMITAFFFQMGQVNGGASRPEGIERSEVTKVGVIGAGMMGQGIANVSAMAGIEVVLKDVSLEAAEKGKAYTAKLMDKAIQRGRADEAKKESVLNLIKATDQDTDLAGCDLIIEAVFEKMELKHQITRSTEGQLAEDGVWGSNTSTLPITQLAEASANPEKFIGIHFFSPVDKMPLVEIICGEKTSDETLAKAFDFVRQIRKTPIVVNDSLGFFTSRTFTSQLNEAAQMVAEGINPLRVDNLGKAIGMPVGPLTIYDEISMRLGMEIRETQISQGLISADDDLRPLATDLINTLVKEYNHGGRYHGDGGFYEYSDAGKIIWPKLHELYYKPELKVSDDDIKDRLLFSNVIESLKCLQEGVLRSVADGNIGSLLGIGAPTWTGGYLQFVNTYGLQRFIDRCDELAEKYGDRFKTPAIVAEKLEAGELFN